MDRASWQLCVPTSKLPVPLGTAIVACRLKPSPAPQAAGQLASERLPLLRRQYGLHKSDNLMSASYAAASLSHSLFPGLAVPSCLLGRLNPLTSLALFLLDCDRPSERKFRLCPPSDYSTPKPLCAAGILKSVDEHGRAGRVPRVLRLYLLELQLAGVRTKRSSSRRSDG